MAAAGWSDLAVGDELFVRGRRVSATGTIRARFLVIGGFRVLAGSIKAMDVLENRLELSDFGSGASQWIRFDFVQIYVAARGDRSDGRHGSTTPIWAT